jgi:hypothetical protein
MLQQSQHKTSPNNSLQYKEGLLFVIENHFRDLSIHASDQLS